MRNKLPEILKPVLERIGHRLERFAGKPAAATAVLILKTDDAADVVREFVENQVAVQLERGQEPIKLRVTSSSPPWLRKWNGFTMGVKQILKRDPCVVDTTVNRRGDVQLKVTELLVQVGESYILKLAAEAH